MIITAAFARFLTTSCISISIVSAYHLAQLLSIPLPVLLHACGDGIALK